MSAGRGHGRADGPGADARPGPGTVAAERPPAPALTGLLLLVLLATLAATVWGLAQSRADDAPHHLDPGSSSSYDDWVDAGAARIRLESFSARDQAHQMPGMNQNLADPVPDGARRLATTVTVVAAADSELQLSGSDFTLSGPEVTSARPVRAQLGDGRLPAGDAMTLELVFDVPESTRDGLVLSYRGASVKLPDLAASVEHPVPDPDPQRPSAPTAPQQPSHDTPHDDEHHDDDGH